VISEPRPPAKRKFDQFGVTEETLEARANFLAEGGFLKDSKILFLGDYDLTSLACLTKAQNSEIWVLDIDGEVLEIVKKESQGSIFTIQHNLITQLPSHLPTCVSFASSRIIFVVRFFLLVMGLPLLMLVGVMFFAGF